MGGRSPKLSPTLSRATAVQLVVTCAKAKRGAIPLVRHLRSIRQASVTRAAATWIHRLEAAKGESVLAADLYYGDHWRAASDAAAIATSSGGRAWVCSAGYGLVPLDARVQPYSATFTSADPDTVLRFHTSTKESVESVWWEALANWEGPTAGSPRRVATLAARFPTDLLVVAVSEPYLRALTPDLLATRAALASPDRLLILCGGAPDDHPLSDNLLRWDPRAQIVEGAMASMNARVVRRLLRELPAERLSMVSARKQIASWATSAAPRLRPERMRVSDTEIREFIRDRFSAGAVASPSGLHREFREAGLACERLRFLSLFRSVLEE
jgi:hypothetical protein